MTIVFVSNYINHHQIPFCNAMSSLCEQEQGSFYFIQTQPMEEERVRMGWQPEERPDYVRRFYKEEALCRELVRDSEVVLFGGCDDESYIEKRLEAGKPVIRISERLYKTGQWKAVSPRGLRKKYHDHTRYGNAPVYLLCAGGYVASDFGIIRAYQNKMFRWGYFPATKHYDIDALMADKGYSAVKQTERGNAAPVTKKVPYLLWAARLIDWKHPELALETAAYLRRRGLEFHMDLIGGGELEKKLKQRARELSLGDSVTFLGYKTPAQVREYMEKADIFLFTSDRQEGWGAVANEAMNSGCALVADHMIGAVPYLIRQGVNGFIYRDGRRQMLFHMTEQLVKDVDLRQRLGRNAYRTIAESWNAENAAAQLKTFIDKMLAEVQGTHGGESGRTVEKASSGTVPQAYDPYGPCYPEMPRSERAIRRGLFCG